MTDKERDILGVILVIIWGILLSPFILLEIIRDYFREEKEEELPKFQLEETLGIYFKELDKLNGKIDGYIEKLKKEQSIPNHPNRYLGDYAERIKRVSTHRRLGYQGLGKEYDYSIFPTPEEIALRRAKKWERKKMGKVKNITDWFKKIG